MEKLVRRIDLTHSRGEETRGLLRREWLATNGLGGYASGTISGSVTWRYHGLLIAALPAPMGRMVMLNHLAEYIRLADGRVVQIGGVEPSEPEEFARISRYLTEFRLENGLPIWHYEVEGVVIEKHVLFLYGQNTVHINYHLLSAQQDVLLELRPSIHFRGHEHSVDEKLSPAYQVRAEADHYEVILPEHLLGLRMVLMGDQAALTYDGGTRREIYYPKEAERGCPPRGWLWSPGFFSVRLHPRQDATLIASTEWW
jgi:predicted glycogen debranching enzyme